jgi:hypothetical protein
MVGRDILIGAVLGVGFYRPHIPLFAPKKYFDLYSPAESIDLSPNPKAAEDAPPIALTNFGELRAYTNMPKGKQPVSDQQAKELRRVAESSIEAMTKAAITKIEKQSLDLRTQVVGMGLLSAEAKMFLESLAPIEDSMRSLDFGEIERRLEKEQQLRLADRKRLYGGGGIK